MLHLKKNYWDLYWGLTCILPRRLFHVDLIIVWSFWMAYSIDIIKYIWSSVLFKAKVYWLIFSLDDLSTDVSGVLKSPTIIVLVYLLLLYICYYSLYIFRSSCAVWINICQYYIHVLDWPPLSSCNALLCFRYRLCFKVHSVWYECWHPNFLFISVFMEYLFPSLYLQSLHASRSIVNLL